MCRVAMFFKQHGVHRKTDQTVSHKTKLKNESKKNPRKIQEKSKKNEVTNSSINRLQQKFSNVPASTACSLQFQYHYQLHLTK